MPKTKIECPAPACGYNANMDALDAEKERPIILETTRSHRGEDSWRDMDSYDKDEDLSRLRRAIDEVRRMLPKGFARHQKWVVDPKWADAAVPLLAFISEAFSHIDENLTRLGPLPTTWLGSSSVTRLLGRLSLVKDEEAREMGYKQAMERPSADGDDTLSVNTNKMPSVKVHSVKAVHPQWQRNGQGGRTQYKATFFILGGVKLIVDVPEEAYEMLKAQLEDKPYRNREQRGAALKKQFESHIKEATMKGTREAYMTGKVVKPKKKAKKPAQETTT